MNSTWFGLMAAVLISVTSLTSAQETAKPKIVLAGDSTVTDHAGWGTGFTLYALGGIDVVNVSKGGRSSKSFRDEGHWQKALDAKPELILIQFGHND